MRNGQSHLREPEPVRDLAKTGRTMRGTTMRQILAAAFVSTVIALAVETASAQQTAPQHPPDKPPISQGWIDIATFASPGMPGGMAGDDGRHDGRRRGRRRGRHPVVRHVRRQEGRQPVRPHPLRWQRQLHGRDTAHESQPESCGSGAGRARGQQARADAATEGAAAGQAGSPDLQRRQRRGTDRTAEREDQTLLGLRHHDPARAAEGRRLFDRHGGAAG